MDKDREKEEPVTIPNDITLAFLRSNVSANESMQLAACDFARRTETLLHEDHEEQAKAANRTPDGLYGGETPPEMLRARSGDVRKQAIMVLERVLDALTTPDYENLEAALKKANPKEYMENLPPLPTPNEKTATVEEVRPSKIPYHGCRYDSNS